MNTKGIFRGLLIAALVAVVFGCEKDGSENILLEPEIWWSNPSDIVYDTPLGEEQLNASTGIAGALSYTPKAGTILNAGDLQELNVEFTPDDANKYKTVSKVVYINVLKRTPIITWEQPDDMFYCLNAPEPITDKQLNASADTDGEMNYVGLTPGVTVLLPGKHELQVQFVPNDEANYSVIDTTVSIHVSESVQIITDIEGNKYHAIQIGERVWMAENLKATKLNDGTELELVESPDSWIRISKPAYCWYNNEENTYKEIHGALYNYNVIESENICPSGWHVATLGDWESLRNHISSVDMGVESLVSTKGWYSTVDGSTGNADINSKNITGFTAKPSGKFDNTFIYEGRDGYWWVHNTIPFGTYINPHVNYITSFHADNSGLSIRCVKD